MADERTRRPLVYACSGCSSAAQLANHVALQLDRRDVAEMSCIAGVGGDVPHLMKIAHSGRPIIALDGCPLVCVKSSLARQGIAADRHYQLQQYGVKKRQHENFDSRQAAGVLERVEADLLAAPLLVPARDADKAVEVGSACAGPDRRMSGTLRTRRRIIVAVSGASGAVYGTRLLQVLHDMAGVETHLVVSDAGWRNLDHEQGLNRVSVEALADRVHDVRNVGAALASGSFRCSGMVVAPCSMRTLAAVAHGLGDTLLTRAADVMLKERRRLVLLVRESPLHLTHLRNMVSVTEMGAIVCPPLPAFYLRPQSVDEIVDGSVARVLDLLDLPHNLAPRWEGLALPDAGA